MDSPVLSEFPLFGLVFGWLERVGGWRGIVCSAVHWAVMGAEGGACWVFTVKTSKFLKIIKKNMILISCEEKTPRHFILSGQSTRTKTKFPLK